MRNFILVVAMFALMRVGAGQAMAQSAHACIPSASVSHEALSSAVRSINTAGFEDFSHMALTSVPSPLLSPVATWATRFAATMGSSSTPSLSAQSSARALMTALGGRPEIRISTHVWADSGETTYDDAAASGLEKSICAGSSLLHWSLSSVQQAAPVENAMQAWIAAQNTGIPDVSGYLDALNDATPPAQKNNHPLNIITAVSLNARFNSRAGAGSSTVAIPYYDESGVQGVRLDSVRGDLSLYLFTGAASAIAAMQSSLSDDSWRQITKRFSTKYVAVQKLALLAGNDRAFSPGVMYAYGTQLRSLYAATAERTRFAFLGDRLQAGAVSGIEGMKKPSCCLIIDRFARPRTTFSVQAPMIFAIVDSKTGAVLFLGGQMTR